MSVSSIKKSHELSKFDQKLVFQILSRWKEPLSGWNVWKLPHMFKFYIDHDPEQANIICTYVNFPTNHLDTK